MAKVAIADIAKLRTMTGAGMMDCKKALEEAEGNFERAQELIRERGKLIAGKRADRNASEGVVKAIVSNGKAYMVCLACETDFVAKGEEFVATAQALLDLAVSSDAVDTDALMAAQLGEQTVAETITALSGKTGEKVEVPFYARIEAPMTDIYVHMNNKLGTIIAFNKVVDSAISHDVAMQAAAMAPVSISADDCSKEIIEKEYKIGMEQAKAEGKPEAMLDRIAQGKVNKFLKENTLLNQALVKNNKMTVEQYIKEADAEATVVAYKRFSLND
ncbi:MAG: translation elongation factor Ts [Rikenellaceae bacterium]